MLRCVVCVNSLASLQINLCCVDLNHNPSCPTCYILQSASCIVTLCFIFFMCLHLSGMYCIALLCIALHCIALDSTSLNSISAVNNKTSLNYILCRSLRDNGCQSSIGCISPPLLSIEIKLQVGSPVEQP